MNVKTKNALPIALASLVLLMGWLLSRQPQLRNQSPVRNHHEAKRVEEATTTPSSPIERHEAKLQKLQQKAVEPSNQPAYQISPANVVIDPTVEGRLKDTKPFRLLGQGSGSAKIVNKAGNVVLEADPKVGIYGCEVSPNGKQLTAYFASEGSIILEPETGTKIALPKRPPGEHKFVFEHWSWIDDNTLVSASGDQKLDAKGNPVREEANVAQSRLYLYDISHQQLTEVQLPKDFGVKIFSISAVSSKGYVYLVHEDPNATRLPDLGWFAVQPK